MEVILLKLKFWLTPISPYLKEKNLDLVQDSKTSEWNRSVKQDLSFSIAPEMVYHSSWQTSKRSHAAELNRETEIQAARLLQLKTAKWRLKWTEWISDVAQWSYGSEM